MSPTHTHFSSVTPNALDVLYMFTNTFMNVLTHIHQHLISSCMRGEKKWCEMRLTLCEKSGKKGVFILC